MSHNGRLAFLITTGLVLLVYSRTIAPDLTWANWGQDGGELVTAAVTLGLPHPPGYPLYVFLGKLASTLPAGTIAGRLNLLSAASAAAAVGLLAAACCKQYPITWQHGVTAGLTVGFSPLVWSQAVIAEVYAVNLLAAALFLWAWVHKRPSWLIGLFLGLSITSHLTSLLLLPLAFAGQPPRRWPGLIGGVFVGLAPFLLIPWLARPELPAAWGDPFSLAGWWQTITGQIYQPNLFAIPQPRLIQRLLTWPLVLLDQWTAAGWLLLLYSLWRMKEHFRMLAFLIIGSAILYLLYAGGYNTQDALVFTLPVMLLLGMLLPSGMARLGKWAWTLPLALVLLNFRAQDLHTDWQVRQQAMILFDKAPQDAILLTPGDGTIFSLGYFQIVEGIRSDLILVDQNLFAFDWYRARMHQHYPGLAGLQKDNLAAFEQSNGSDRTFCRAALSEAAQLSCLELDSQ